MSSDQFLYANVYFFLFITINKSAKIFNAQYGLVSVQGILIYASVHSLGLKYSFA